MIKIIPIESVLIFVTAHLFLQSRFNSIFKHVVLLLLITADALETMYLQPLPIPVKEPILIFAGIFMLALFYKGEILVKSFFILLVNYIILIVDVISCNMFSYAQNERIADIAASDTNIPYFLLTKLLDVLIIFICIYFFRKLRFEITKKYWVIIDAIIIMFIIVTEAFMNVNGIIQSENHQYTLLVFCIFTGFLLMSIFVIYFFGEICYYYNRDKENSILQIKSQALEQQLLLEKRTEEDILKIRHDINKNLASISYLLKQNNLEDSISYIDAITKTLDETKPMVSTGSKIIDSILNIKLSVCKQQGIAFEYKSDDFSALRLSPVDLCAIIANLLDNAIEANRFVEEGGRYVRFKMFYYKNYLTVVVCNPFCNKLLRGGDLLKTIKSDTARHGYGLKSIRSSTEKHSGEFKFFTQDNVFTATVLLPVNSR